MFGRAPILLGPAIDTSLLTLVAIAVVQRRIPGIRHSAVYVIPGFRQARISVIVPSSRKIGRGIFRNHPVLSSPVPEIRYAPTRGYNGYLLVDILLREAHSAHAYS